MSVNFLKQHKDKKTKHQSQQEIPSDPKSDTQSTQINKRRVFPIWLRLLVVLGLFILCLVIGVVVGYGVIGDGAPLDALKKQTWQHVIDIMTKVE